MNKYIVSILINLKLTARDRMALFFSYAFPLMFFFIFAQIYGSGIGGGIVQVVSSVLIIGVLGNGFFGAGMRAVSERETGILRRYKVAPTTAAPIVVSSLVTGLVNYVPSASLIITLAHFVYGMPWPSRPFSLFIFLAFAVMAFRALGMIVASVVNSMQESQIVIQMLYLPMLFLSGATFPMDAMPVWLQSVAQFLPASHLYNGMQGILIKNETIAANWMALLAMISTIFLASFLSVKLFRWEKEDKIRTSGKVWLLAAMAPFLVLGVYQSYSHENIAKNKQLSRSLRRSRTILIRGARIFQGDGTVIQKGAVLIKDGRIQQIWEGDGPEPKSVKADPIEAYGKTILPGLIDTHIHLGAPGGIPEKYASDPKEMKKSVARELAAYLYSGVTAVKSVGDSVDLMQDLAKLTDSGEKLGSELFYTGPMFTTEGGHGTEYFKNVPAAFRKQVEASIIRLPKTREEAAKMVTDLKPMGVTGIKAILEAGGGSFHFNRMDTLVLAGIADGAKANALPLVVHTGDDTDVGDAIAVGANGIEHGSIRDKISDAHLAAMAKQGIAFAPTLAVVDAVNALRSGNLNILARTLFEQSAPRGLIEATKKALAKNTENKGPAFPQQLIMSNAKRAAAAGVMLVTGTDSGNVPLIHGPAVHRELQLMVQAGLTTTEALKAATSNAARLLGVANRIGFIKPGYEATFLIVDGNPLDDISLTERVSLVFLKGERVARGDLFDDDSADTTK